MAIARPFTCLAALDLPHRQQQSCRRSSSDSQGTRIIYGQRRSTRAVGAAAGRAEACGEGRHQEATLHPSRQRQDASEGNSKQTVQGRAAGTGQRSGRGSAAPAGSGGAGMGSSAPAAAEGHNLEHSTAVPGGSDAGRQRQGREERQRNGWSKRPDGSTTAGTGAAGPSSKRHTYTPRAPQHAAGIGRGSAQGHYASISAPRLTSLIKDSSDAHSLMQLVERYQQCSSFNHIHAAAALTRFAKLAQLQRLPREQGHAWVAKLVAIVSSHLSSAGARELVNMLHAVATLQSKTQLGPADPGFVKQLVTALQGSVSMCNPQGAANALWALATLGITWNQSLTNQLVSKVEAQVSCMKPQELSNSLWALATLGGDQHSHSCFIQAWVREAGGRLSDFNAQALANSLWALATLRGHEHSYSGFIQAWVREAEGRLSEFKPQALSNSLWALATLRCDQHSHSHFIQAWVREASGRLSDFKPQELSNSLWALAILRGDQHNHRAFIQAWVREAEGRLSNFNAQALANSLWALSNLGHTDCSFTARLLQVARAQLPVFNAQDVSNTTLALGTLRYQDPDFMQQLAQRARSRLPDMTPQALANTLWAMAWLDYNDAAFADDAVRHLLQRRGSFNRQELCNTLWALCILDHSPAAVLQPLLAEAQSMLLRPATVAGHSDKQPELLKHQCQAYQYLVTMEAQGHISPQLKAQHMQLWEVCQAAWAEQLQQVARASFTQQQVLQAVRELPGCVDATCEQLTEDGLQSIDVALQLPEGSKVAVEVDGPMHFMANAPDVPDGSTVWRNRMLKLRGWRVVSVPVVQWLQLGSSAEKQRVYLLQRFAQAGAQLPCATSNSS